MSFNHKVHHTDAKGKINKVTPYTKVCRLGCPEIYFDHDKKRFFDPGTMEDADMKHIPDDVYERYMGKSKVAPAKKVEAKLEEAAPMAEEVAEAPIAKSMAVGGGKKANKKATRKG